MKHLLFRNLLLLALAFMLGVNSSAQNENSAIYVNDMDYVLGDVKQAFITNAITTTTQADNLIEGFKTMKVNGIRIPIYADGVNPNETMYDYFYNQAVAAGFKIFANPAQSSGGQRIACGILDGTLSTVNGNSTYTNNLINRIKNFASEYPCDWINPFNEDGAPDAAWSTSQMNSIYSSLYNNVNGAELIGPCVWGIPSSISVMSGTDIRDYISIAATHNLGFNHTYWSSFIELADANNLPVWDSEVNNTDKYGTGSRIVAAIEAGVDGLVIYNSWNNISLTDGSISSGGEAYMDLYLKFRTDKKYYIDCPNLLRRLASTGESEDAYTTSTSTTGEDVEWVFVAKGNGYYHIRRAAGGSMPGIRTDGTAFADMQTTASNGTKTYYDFTPGYTDGSYHMTLPDYSTDFIRVQVTNTGVVKMVDDNSNGGWTSFTFTEAGDYSTSSKAAISEPIVEALDEDVSIDIYPNPVTQGIITIKVSSSISSDQSSATLYSLDGRVIMEKTFMDNLDEKVFDVGDQLEGLYILQFQQGSNVRAEKIYFN